MTNVSIHCVINTIVYCTTSVSNELFELRVEYWCTSERRGPIPQNEMGDITHELHTIGTFL